TPCFRCLFTSVPPPGVIPTCDRAGVISPAPAIIGSLQSVEAMKILTDAKEISRDAIYIDVWQGVFDRFKPIFRPDCPTCQGNYEFLQRQFGVRTTVLCGQYSVQVLDPEVEKLSLPELAKHLKASGEVSYNENTVNFRANGHEIVIFPDGRLILRNSFDESLARELYVKYIGA
ncbi:MAG: ThiF family adenylyltransferase, partial [Dehalococcoidia bacterium]|nr:ThiF family adenylyltransferase [Dehalococcoidia bacterium]